MSEETSGWIKQRRGAPRPRGLVKVRFSGETVEHAEATEFDLAQHYKPAAWLGYSLPRIIAYRPARGDHLKDKSE